MTIQPAFFETQAIRRAYDEEAEVWWFSVVDIAQVLTQQPDCQAARNYWKVLKNRLVKEGSQSVTDCHRLKMLSADTPLRLIQSPPSSPKAEGDMTQHATRDEHLDPVQGLDSKLD